MRAFANLTTSILVLAAFAVGVPGQDVAPEGGDAVVGALDGQPVTADAFATFLARKYRNQPTGANLLGDLRDRTLIELAATRLGLSIDAAAVDREYRALADRVSSETDGKQTLEDYLTRKGTTVAEFKTYLRRLVAAREIIRLERKLPASAQVDDKTVATWLVEQAKRVGVTTDATLPKGVYLRVGDRRITEVAFGHQLAAGLTDQDRAKELDAMIKLRLIARELAANGLQVTDVDLDRAIALDRARYANNPRTKGIPYEKILEQLGTSVAQKKADPEFRGNVAILKIAEARFDDAALRSYFEANQDRFGESVRVRHIVVRVQNPAQPFRGGHAEADAKKRIDAIRKRIVDGGEPFDKVARTASEDRSRLQGGDLGFIHRNGRFDPAFAKAAFALEPGTVSEPVRSAFGYHLLEVLERRPAPEFAAARTRLVRARAQDWFRDVVRGAKIENRYLDAIRAEAAEAAKPKD